MSDRSLAFCLLLALSACGGKAIDSEQQPMPGPGKKDAARGPNAGGDAGAPEPDAGTSQVMVPTGPSSFVCDPAKASVPVARLWRLTADQINASIKDLTGETETAVRGDLFRGSAAGGFQNSADGLSVTGGQAIGFRLVTKAVAARTVADEARLTKVFASNGCDAKKLGDNACARQFVTTFGRRAFRRPLTPAEVDRYAAIYALGKGKDLKLGVQSVIQAMLQSPNFLFRSELGADGTGKVKLAPYELAAALSFLLTGSTPDDMLLDAAEKNQLSTPAQVEAQAKRLLADRKKASPALAEFFRQLFEFQGLATRPKDAKLFPEYESVRGDMNKELEWFVDDLVFGTGDGKLQTLLTANYTFVTPALAKVYDPNANLTGTPPLRMSLNPAQRAGVLTMPGVMSVQAVLERTSPVNRGRFVMERLFCAHIPDPPPTVNTAVGTTPPGATFRQTLEQLTSPSDCAACHSLMNPIGFGLENLDGIGRWRPKDNEVDIDASGKLMGTDVDGEFKGPRELANKLASSKKVAECVTTQSFRYHFGQSETDLDGDYGCTLKSIYEKFAGSGFSLKELVVGAVASEAFTHRFRVAPPPAATP